MRIGWIVASVVVACAGTILAPHADTVTKDTYAWLEDIHGARALNWVRDQNASTLTALQADPQYMETRAAAEGILSAKDTQPNGRMAGANVFNFVQDAEHPLGQWRRMSLKAYRAGSDQWVPMVDLDAINAKQKIVWKWKGATCLPPSHSQCLVRLQRQGSVVESLQEFDVKLGKFVSGGFNLQGGKINAEWVDADTLLIAADWGKGSLTKQGNPRIAKTWSRGEPIQTAETIFEGQTGDVGVSPKAIVNSTGKVSLFVVRELSPGNEHVFAISETGKPMRISVPVRAAFKGLFQRQLLFVLNQDWRSAGKTYLRGSLISFSFDRFVENGGAIPHIHQAFIPTSKTIITAVASSRGAVYLSVLDNVQGRINELTFDGEQWFWRRVALPDLGSAEIICASDAEDAVILKFSGFLTPETIYIANRGRDPKPVRQSKPRFDPDGAEVTQYEAISNDGTKVPYFVVRNPGKSAPNDTPTLLYAFGGFQVSTTPWYWSSAGKLWLEKGGAYVVANVRGGGEFGPRWHEAATRENRQRSFDDLAAVARDLMARGLTSPRRLGIFGSSQGGLLVAGTFVQHPGLFNAVVSQVPLTDMLRYTRLAKSQNWTGEYGDPADPKMRTIIATWSPYQNIRPGVRYPSVFLLTSSKDARIHPAHARKMAAKLESFGQPVMYYEDGDSSNVHERAEQLALTFTYFRRALMN